MILAGWALHWLATALAPLVPLHLRRRLATALAPLVPLHLRRRAVRGKEIPARLSERQGFGAERPPGHLFWLHAASVGETQSALPVLAAMAARAPALHFLVTTGTVTSAELLAQRLPPELAAHVTHRFLPLDVPAWVLPPELAAHVTHRFLPLDVPAWVARFLDGWHPEAGAFVESELWPNLLAAARARALPLALVNGRVSGRSFARRRWLPGLTRATLGAFHLVLARSEADRARLAVLGAPRVLCWGDLKAAAPPLPADPAALARLRATIGTRPVFLAASTHPGEEALAVAAHRRLVETMPDLLTVLVPLPPAGWRRAGAGGRGLCRGHDRRARPVLSARGRGAGRRLAGAAWRAEPAGSGAARLPDPHRTARRQFRGGRHPAARGRGAGAGRGLRCRAGGGGTHRANKCFLRAGSRRRGRRRGRRSGRFAGPGSRGASGPIAPERGKQGGQRG